MIRLRGILLIGGLIGLTGSAAPAAARTGLLASSDVRRGADELLVGGNAASAAATRDTLYLLGGPGRLDGTFEDASGQPDWHGWSRVDVTQPGGHWNVSTYRAEALGGHGAGNHALWCGATYANDCAAGYGNDWNASMIWSAVVANPATPTTVRVQGVFNHDTEPGYDDVRLQVWADGAWQTLLEVDGVDENVLVDESAEIPAGGYAGTGGDGIWIRWQVTSDGAWSDEDCLYDSQGACQIDDLVVSLDGAIATSDDFEPGSPVHWIESVEPGVGNFAAIWSNLIDLDPCASNRSPQVAFIDDGNVVPGTGGSPCITWCYGPGGYVVNTTGGLAGPAYHLSNVIESPVLAVPEGYAGAMLSFTAYLHENLASGSAGIYADFNLRSTAAVDPAAIADARWENYGFATYWGGPAYRRVDQRVDPLLVPGARWVQVQLNVDELGWLWGFDGNDATPAPYFDDVALKVFQIQGPSVTARSIDLAQDSFPARGELDLVNLANDAVRFDMAASIAPDDHLHNDPGDSIIVDVVPVRAGAVLEDRPRMIVKLKANPLFDAVRVLPPNFTQSGNVIDGWVYGDSTRTAGGTVVRNRYNFDLPDSNFFFPGDVIQYYFTAADRVNGDVGVTNLPDKLDGFGDYTAPMAYPNVFTVRALPSLRSASGDQPRILFWNDAPDRGRDAHWIYALNGLGYNEQADYDLYETNGASSGVGNGLGGRATPQTLAGYMQLLYTCGDLGAYTLGNNDVAGDPSNDIGVLTNWFALGNKKAFMTGDDLVQSLASSGPAHLAFMNTFLNVRHVSGNLLPLVSNQTAPRVRPVAGNSVFSTPSEWVAFGGCPGINDFDAVETQGPSERLARFLDPSGNPNYTYAAATRYTSDGHDVILLPYDLSFVQSPPGYVPPRPGLAVRTEVLRDVLITFGGLPHGEPIAVPEAPTLSVSAGPNPFNPRCAIALDLPRAGVVALRLYDIRGRLVRTLHDGALDAGRHELFWSGDDDAGRALASGVYFYEVKAADEERVGKLTLVR